MAGAFEQPPKGPEIGPIKNYNELSEDKKAALGDLASLGKQAAPQAEAPAEEPTKSPEQIADEIERMREVLAEEVDESPYDPLAEEAVPSENDKRRFLRATLGNQPYEKVYQLFDGEITMTMVDLTPAEEEQLFGTLGELLAEDKIATQAEYDTAHDKLRLVFHMKDIRIPGDKPPAGVKSLYIKGKPDMGMDKVDEFLREAFGSATLYRAAMRVSRVFILHLEQLLEEVLRPDFWTAGGPDSQ